MMIEFFRFIDAWLRNENRILFAGSVFGACVIYGVWQTLLSVTPDSFYARFVLFLCAAATMFYVIVAVQILRKMLREPQRVEPPVSDDPSR